MNNDIRVAVTCPDHPKIKKLMARLGDKSFWNLVRFWCFVAVNKPSGDISCYDAEDIEIGAGWTGESGVFYSALIKLRFIEKHKERLLVHDWQQHNSWAFGAEKRIEKARLAAKSRWSKDKEDATSIN